MIEVKRKTTKEVEEVVKMELRKKWYINIVYGKNSLTVVERLEYDYEPKEQEIVSALLEYNGNDKYFASVIKRYELVEVQAW